jgi:uncharacterized membrane protein YfcA
MVTDWHFYLVAIPAVMLQGMGKGGFAGMGALSLPMMCLVLPPVQAVAIQLPILMAQDLVGVWAYRRNVHWQNLQYCMPGIFIGIAAGTIIAAKVTPAAVQLVVGLIATVFVLVSVGRAAGDAKPATPALGKATLWCSIGGFTSFVANAGGVPVQVYLMPQKLAPAVYAGTIALLFAIVNYVKFGVFIAIDQISAPNLATSAVLLPVAVASTFVGVWMVKHMSGAKFYPIIRTLTFFIGLKLIWDGAGALLRAS